MSNEDGTVWLTFNGEIYNHAALRPELEARGPPLPLAHRHRGRSSTSTRRRAPRCVEHLDGMFALRDLGRAHRRAVPRPRPARHQAALLRRSRPAASSSARRSRRCSSTRRSRPELDEEAFHHYLTFVCTPAPLTMFEGIRKLGPGRADDRSRADGSTVARRLLDAVARDPSAARSPRCREAGACGAAAGRSCASSIAQAHDERTSRSACSSRAASTRRPTSR